MVHLPPAEGSGAPDGLFGFSQLTGWGLLLSAAIAGIVLAASRLPVKAARFVLAGAFGTICFLLRSWFINPDGALFPMKFMVDVPARGFHATHDEMWELYVHSRVWYYMNEYVGWSVVHSYQVLSSLAGGVFIYLLVAYWQRMTPHRWALTVLASLAGGYVQLFFGDAENYTLTTTLVMAYFLGAVLFLDEVTSIVVPSLLLAIALTFHLEAGFLLPSLVYLLLVAYQRGQHRALSLAVTGFAFVVAGTLLFFHLEGLPIGDLVSHSHAFGDGGHFLEMLNAPSGEVAFQIANLAFLLVPAWVLVVPLIAYRRIALDRVNVHLLVASGVMTVFVLLWKAQLGVYNDWNLYAMAGVPISLLVWRNVFRLLDRQRMPWPIAAAIGLFLLHSCSWIVTNHLK